MKRNLLGAGVLAALATAGLSAQSFLPTGTSVGGGDDQNVDLVLPFLFTFPDGVATDMIRVDTNGKITQTADADPSDLGESLLDFGAQSTIAAYWDDLNGTGQVFYDTSVAGVATISWVDTIEFGNTANFTFQVQLAATGVITIVWDNRTIAPTIDGDVLVGISDGTGTPANPEVDFSDVFNGNTIVGGTNVYELFTTGQFDLADGVLAETGLVFTPTMTGYDVTGIVPPPPANVVLGRRACANAIAAPSACTLVSTAPGWVVSAGGTFDANYAMGTAVHTTGDDAMANYTAAFTVTLPGGVVTDTIGVDTNGRIVQGGLGEGADFSPSVLDLRGDAEPVIAPFWTDLNLTINAGNGICWVHEIGTSAISVTWENVIEFGGAIGEENTFQCIIHTNGDLEFHYQELRIGDDTILIGAANAGGADLGGSDLTSLPVSAGDVIYELFNTTSNLLDLDDIPQDIAKTATITATNFPILGQNLEVDTADSTGTAVLVAYFFGFPTGIFVPSIDLGILDPNLTGCEVYADIVTPGAIFGGGNSAPGTPVALIAIPNIPALAGVTGLVVSGIVINPATSPALYPTDELITTIGG
jgi:hypothetical protein